MERDLMLFIGLMGETFIDVSATVAAIPASDRMGTVAKAFGPRWVERN
jgi:hypothetical protein